MCCSVFKRFLCGLVLTGLMVPVTSADTLAVRHMAQPATSSDWPAWVADRQALQFDLVAFQSDAPLAAELLPGRQFRLLPGELQRRSRGAYTWRGRIADGGRPVGAATLTVAGERIRGLVRIGKHEYIVSTSPRGHQWLDRVDPAERPPMDPPGGPLIPEDDVNGSQQPQKVGTPADHADDPAVVDVIAFYTADSISAYTDEAELRLAIQNAMNLNNTALINSNIESRVRLMAVFPWDYTETGTGSDALYTAKDSTYIAELQDQYSADLAAVVTTDSDVCGVAFLLGNYTESWPNGYSMTYAGAQCLGGQTLAHELGHNIGLSHDPANAGNPGDLIEPFSYGHFVDYEFRTIMSYWNECPGSTGSEQYTNGCPQIDHFSDPAINDSGSGLPTGTSDRNNAEVLRRSMPHVANWYEAPATLAEAAGAPSVTLETGGSGLWAAQQALVPSGSSTALISGPAFDSEQSWLEMTASGSGVFNVEFDMKATVADGDGQLRILADGSELAVFDSIADTWTRETVAVPSGTDDLRWVWEAQAGATDPEAVGRVALTGMDVGTLEQMTLYGEVRNSLGDTVADVDLQVLDENDAKVSGVVKTNSQGLFEVTAAHWPDLPPSVFAAAGSGVIASSHDIADGACQDEADPCELVIDGVARSIAGEVTGMLSGESVEISAGAGVTATVTADSTGTVSFDLPANAVVLYGPLEANATGYQMTSAPEDDISVRDGDLIDFSIGMDTQAPTVSAIEVVDRGRSSLSIDVAVDPAERATTVTLYVTPEDGEAQELEQTLTSPAAGEQSLSFSVNDLECETDVDLRVEAVNDHDQTGSRNGSADTANCPDSDSGGCTIGASGRMDPLLVLMFLVAFVGVVRRRG